MPNFKNTFLLFGLVPLAAPALANDKVYYRESYGAFFYPEDPDNYTLSLFSEAERHPNATRSVSFKPFATIENSRTENLTDIEWTWRVNVSDFSVPNAENYFTALEDPRLVHTTYDFSWSHGSIDSVVPPSVDELCIQWMDVLGNPANISNAYTEDNTDSTDCTQLLGGDCVNAIVSDARSGYGSCAGILQGWALMPECASTFGYIWNRRTKDYVNNQGASIYSSDGDSDATVESGERFWHATSSAYNGSNTTVYPWAANKLQVMMLAPIMSEVAHPQLMCMRVNTTHLDESDDNNGSGNNDDGGGDGDGDGEGAGSLVQFSSGLAVLVSFVWVLVVTNYIM